MIKQNSIKYLFLSLVLSASACSGSKGVQETASEPLPEKTETVLKDDEPNGFITVDKPGTLVTAEVIEIPAPVRYDSGSESICEKVPCTARLKIASLIEIGRFFDYSFGEGDAIGAYFTFSLAATTEELFPNVDVSYPGLKVGDRIKATVLVQSPNNDFPYTIDHYEILKNE
jgi:hypothetical protein